MNLLKPELSFGSVRMNKQGLLKRSTSSELGFSTTTSSRCSHLDTIIHTSYPRNSSSLKMSFTKFQTKAPFRKLHSGSSFNTHWPTWNTLSKFQNRTLHIFCPKVFADFRNWSKCSNFHFPSISQCFMWHKRKKLKFGFVSKFGKQMSRM